MLLVGFRLVMLVVLQWIMQVGHQNFRKLCGGVLVCAGYVSFIKRYLTVAKLIKILIYSNTSVIFESLLTTRWSRVFNPLKI